MPYAKRNEQGLIAVLYAQMNDGATEWVDAGDPEVQEFLGINSLSSEGDEIIDHLSTSDIRMVRVLEDLLEVLIVNKVILFTDLPTAAQMKLLERKTARSKLGFNGDDLLSSTDNDETLLI
jgi:hypothetical protein